MQTSIGGTTVARWDSNEVDREGMRRYLLHASRGLVETRAVWGLQPISFIHESVREYFLSGGLKSVAESSPHLKPAAGHAHIAEGCMTYIELVVNRPDFLARCKPRRRTRITGIPKDKSLYLMQYAFQTVLHHTEFAFANEMVDLDILERLPLQHATMLLGIQSRWPRFQEYDNPSLLYLLLDQDCFDLARAMLTRSPKLVRCLIASCGDTIMPCTHTHLVKSKLKVAYEELVLAISRRRGDFLRLLLDKSDVNMEAAIPLICFAVLENRHDMLQILLDYGAYVDAAETRDLLRIATKHAYGEMVQILLENGIGVDVNGTDR